MGNNRKGDVLSFLGWVSHRFFCICFVRKKKKVLSYRGGGRGEIGRVHEGEDLSYQKKKPEPHTEDHIVSIMQEIS